MGYSLRHIKSYSGGRGLVSNQYSRRAGAQNSRVTNSKYIQGLEDQSNSVYNTETESLREQLKTYTDISKNASKQALTDGAKLGSESSSSMFAVAEKTGKTAAIVSTAKDFVNDYNKLLTGLNTLGGKENQAFVKQITEAAKANQDKLAEVGVTFLKDGSLAMNPNIMEKATLEQLKEAFNGKETWTSKVSGLCGDIQKNVEERYRENIMLLGGSNANSARRYSKTLTSGAYFNKRF